MPDVLPETFSVWDYHSGPGSVDFPSNFVTLDSALQGLFVSGPEVAKTVTEMRTAIADYSPRQRGWNEQAMPPVELRFTGDQAKLAIGALYSVAQLSAATRKAMEAAPLGSEAKSLISEADSPKPVEVKGVIQRADDGRALEMPMSPEAARIREYLGVGRKAGMILELLTKQ